MSPEKDKINGFDRWEIESAADTLIKTQAIIQDKRKGFYDTVREELTKKVAAADAAALEARTAEKLHKTFKKE